MPRWFRFYGKKRGDRRTGSHRLGSLGEALFFTVFLTAGGVFFGIMFGNLVIPEWRANRQFAQTECAVDQVSVRVVKDADNIVSYLPDVAIHYEVDGKHFNAVTYDIRRAPVGSHEAALAAVAAFAPGEKYPCWYDTIDPQQSVVVRGYSGFLYLLLLIPVCFIGIGGGGLAYTLLHWGSSAERRAALRQRAAKLDIFEKAIDGTQAFPTVPTDANFTNSPGTTLAYRLPVGAAPGWILFAALAACLIWNGVVVMFVVMVFRGHLTGEPNWGLTFFVIPFVLIGLGLVAYLLRQLVHTTGVGPTRIEISDHPLAPGEQYEILISQAGRLSINSLEVLLTCHEHATYRQGTDTRTEDRQVYVESVFRRDEFEILPATPFESRCSLRIPATAMHSFKAVHNEVHWKLRVRGGVQGWPDFVREFPVIVTPQRRGAGSR